MKRFQISYGIFQRSPSSAKLKMPRELFTSSHRCVWLILKVADREKCDEYQMREKECEREIQIERQRERVRERERERETERERERE